TMQALEFPWTF
nr:immunoglobulin light chain junction region [Macaca mulatta]